MATSKGNVIRGRTWIFKNEEAAQFRRGSSGVPYPEFSRALLTGKGASKGHPKRAGGIAIDQDLHRRCDFCGAFKEK